MTRDLQLILDEWPYESGTVTVRKVKGLDGTEKLQMRLQLGILQMEATGRPDGQRPHGYKSLLEYFQDKLKEEGDSFELSPEECSELRDETLGYYYRYLSLYHLEEYAGVARDTQRNLEVFDLMKKYAKTDADKFSLEQYRPYVVMMNSQARAHLALGKNDLSAAYTALQEGMVVIYEFFGQYGQPALAKKSEEYKVLNCQADELKDRLPRDPLEVLREKLQQAVDQERFEEAARLRDKIKKLEQPQKT